MRHFEQLSNSETALALKLTPQAASMRNLRAMRRRVAGELGRRARRIVEKGSIEMMADSSDDGRNARLAELLDELTDAARAGGQPLDIDALAAAHPDLAEELRRCGARRCWRGRLVAGR